MRPSQRILRLQKEVSTGAATHANRSARVIGKGRHKA